MPRATPPPSLPPDLLDGLQDALEGIAALADLLALVGSAVDPGFLQPRTVATAAALIEGQTCRIRRLLDLHPGS